MMTIRQFFMPLTFGALSLSLALSCAWSQQYTISTYAGNGTAGFSGDSGAPTSAQLDGPVGLAFDSSGNIYIADSVNQRVRKISGGTITTVAGNGTLGYLGDGAAATSAELNGPAGVAVDSSGNLYIADTANHVIRMVTTSGTISTFAGNNTGGYAGDGGPAIDAMLDFPTSVAVDNSGNVYIADSGNNVIRVVSAGNINTIVGANGVQFLNDPESVLVDASGNLYISEQSGYRISKFSNGNLTVLAGNGNIGYSGDNGPGNQASVDEPTGMALDSRGYLYFCDTDNSLIRKISPNGIITTIAGTFIGGNATPGYYGDGGFATNALLSFPRGILVDSSFKVYIADTSNNVLRELVPVAPAISAGGVVNAASFTAHLSPGALASVFGSNFTGAGLQATAPLPLPRSLGGVSVLVNGVAAPVLYANSDQVNFQIPWETKAGSATVAVSINGTASATVNVTIQAAAPGLFVQGSHAIVQNFPDYSLNSSSNPIKVGGTIISYLTGAGPVSPQPADGVAAGSNSVVTSTVTASIGGQPATVSFAGLAPTFVGLWQVNIVVPAGLSAGESPLTVTAGGQTSNSGNVSVTP
jgi:uncharacterized protein (TIGR03437 family)